MSDENPSISALAEIAQSEPQNLQAHANKIVSLEFFADDASHHKLFKDLKFPNLENLWLDASDYNEGAHLEQYLQPKLKRFIFYGGPISDSFLDKLQASCPLLEELLIDNPRDLISPEGFLRFLDGAKALKRISVMYGMSRAINDSVIIALATKPGLEILEFQELITTELALRIVAERSRNDAEEKLLPEFREFICVAEPGGLTSILPYLSKLTRLEANIVYEGFPLATIQDRVIHNIASQCIHLHTLKLEYRAIEGQHIHIPSDGLAKLAQRLSKLEELSISGNGVEAPEFGDPQFASIIQAQPRLKVLHLRFTCYLTESSLAEAAKYGGTRLEELELNGTYSLLNLVSSDVLFPQLLSLELGQLAPLPLTDDAIAREAANIARLLKKIAPRLQYFDVMSGNTVSDMVSYELDEI
ncbi:hypothetical protein F5Y00DRAFT_170074 [Daldinia vernicosa]|uniref:uncharacterized protein n=1 Tax=Daldinia vernicosa TaxID=114800 RepID=UPI0020084752|nr:uncharacterized protein F5Y00DRAFT_170074 [Daldinia vernicosa]KAI0845373.1 hypothetical protein F5Y00DRAFT_170074 [Daldinia vernicosa]